jgi:hypothetical protein
MATRKGLSHDMALGGPDWVRCCDIGRLGERMRGKRAWRMADGLGLIMAMYLCRFAPSLRLFGFLLLLFS